MPKANELKKGHVVEISGQPYIVSQIEVKSPSSRSSNTLYKIRLNHARTKQKLDETFKGEDMLGSVDLERRKVQFSYMEGDDTHVFMDDEDYSQYHLGVGQLREQKDFICEGIEGIVALLIDRECVGVELPQSVIMNIVDTAPSIKGASASARTKPATLNTGLIVQVPEYLETGERIKVNTQEVRYMSRA